LSAIVALGALLLFCHTTPLESTNPNIKGNTYDNPVVKFKLSVPNGWDMAMDRVMFTDTAAVVGWKNDFDVIQPGFSVYIDSHSGSDNMDTILGILEILIKDQYSEVSILSKAGVDVNGKMGGSIVFTFTSLGYQMQEKILFFIHNRKDLQFTFFALAEDYKDVEKEFNYVQKSLKFY